MFSSFALIKAFFSHWIGLTIAVLVFTLSGMIFIEHKMIQDRDQTIATQLKQLGADQAVTALWQASASSCTAGVTQLQQASVAASKASQEAVTQAEVKSQTYTDHAAVVLATKPVSKDDYTASRKLMNDLIDHRQALLNGVSK